MPVPAADRPQLRYPLHFLLLTGFAVLLGLLPAVAATPPIGAHPRLMSAIYGAAHAVALVASSRRRRGVAPAISFVAAAALLGAGAGAFFVHVMQSGGRSEWWRLVPPAAGALAYAILVRALLMRIDRVRILAAPAAGALGFSAGMSLTALAHSLITPVACWWFTFSLWLYWADARSRRMHG